MTNLRSARPQRTASRRTPLSSDAKCNTPRRFDIGKVVQDLKECCHAILFASVGGRKETRSKRFARWLRGGRWAPLPGRLVGRKPPHLPGAAAERTPFGRALAAQPFAAGAINCAGGVEAILEREAALRLFVGDRLAEGWTPGTDLRLVEIREWNRGLRAIGCVDNLRLHLSDRTEDRGLVALSDASPQTPSPASRQSLARRHQ